MQEIQEGPRRSHLLVSVDKNGATTIEDRVVELDRDTGKIVQTWDVGQVLDPTRTALINSPMDWFHNNGIAYSSSDDTLVLSGRHQGVIKIGRSNQLVWILAPHRGWNSPHAERLLTAVSSAGTAYPDDIQDGGTFAGAGEFDWSWGQHAPSLLPNGDLLLFDNGWNRRFDLTAVQRNLKALGTFGHQTTARHNAVYIQYMPRTLHYARANLEKYPRFARLRELLASHIEEFK